LDWNSRGLQSVPFLTSADCGSWSLPLDIDPAKVDAINRGESYIKHIDSAAVAELVSAGRLRATTDFSLIGGERSDVGLSAIALAEAEGQRSEVHLSVER
jgi:UDP-N-acetyl-D-mannosaminuronate dehydrogenase